ncbi:BLUF domain-containing protein [Cognaticolwellia aestuarii]|uniref:BLUF domain-containing protein n=1 Tax=Cognaticolwellia aestuarii TaxID=329993 RepID=UPI0009872E16|nr:BLUF domain-containing protein [Cognaticolwellia aestuarii]
MEQLTQLIYVSSAKKLLCEEELNDMLTQARKANKKHHITGLLLYQDGNFMQVIEGEAEKIEQLFTNISEDYRHSGIILLLKQAITRREFPDWSMAFKKLSPTTPTGFSDFLSSKRNNGLQPGNAKIVLLSFKDK